MEEDRLETNLGPSSETAQEALTPAKVPKKRFVGRKTATERADKQDGIDAKELEGKGAIQGMMCHELRIVS